MLTARQPTTRPRQDTRGDHLRQGGGGGPSPRTPMLASFATVAVRVPPGLVKSGAGACRGFARSRELPRGSITSNSAVASFAAPSPPPAVWPRGGTGSKEKAFLGVIPKPANRVWEMPRGPQAAGRAVWGLHDPHRPKPHVPWPCRPRNISFGLVALLRWETSRQVGTRRLSCRPCCCTTNGDWNFRQLGKLDLYLDYALSNVLLPSRLGVLGHLQLVGRCHFGEIMIGAC